MKHYYWAAAGTRYRYSCSRLTKLDVSRDWFSPCSHTATNHPTYLCSVPCIVWYI